MDGDLVLPDSLTDLAFLAHCEGVATGPDGTLWTGDEQGSIYRVDPDSGAHARVAGIDGWALGLALDASSRVYVCDYTGGRIARIDPATGAVEPYCEGLGTPNWCAFAPDGGLYVSNSGSEDEPDGTVLRVRPGGGAFETLDLGPLHFPNGLALAPDGTLYVAESFGTPGVRAWRDGELRSYRTLPGTVPDGLALTDDGGLVVTVFQPNQVLFVPAGGGEPEVFLEDWTGQRLLTPTNAAFYGPGLRRLAVASLCGWSLATVETPWTGQPLAYPHVP